MKKFRAFCLLILMVVYLDACKKITFPYNDYVNYDEVNALLSEIPAVEDIPTSDLPTKYYINYYANNSISSVETDAITLSFDNNYLGDFGVIVKKGNLGGYDVILSRVDKKVAITVEFLYNEKFPFKITLYDNETQSAVYGYLSKESSSKFKVTWYNNKTQFTDSNISFNNNLSKYNSVSSVNGLSEKMDHIKYAIDILESLVNHYFPYASDSRQVNTSIFESQSTIVDLNNGSSTSPGKQFLDIFSSVLVHVINISSIIANLFVPTISVVTAPVTSLMFLSSGFISISKYASESDEAESKVVANVNQLSYSDLKYQDYYNVQVPFLTNTKYTNFRVEDPNYDPRVLEAYTQLIKQRKYYVFYLNNIQRYYFETDFKMKIDNNLNFILKNSGEKVKEFVRACVIKINSPGSTAVHTYTVGGVYKVTKLNGSGREKHYYTANGVINGEEIWCIDHGRYYNSANGWQKYNDNGVAVYDAYTWEIFYRSGKLVNDRERINPDISYASEYNRFNVTLANKDKYEGRFFLAIPNGESY